MLQYYIRMLPCTVKTKNKQVSEFYIEF